MLNKRIAIHANDMINNTTKNKKNTTEAAHSNELEHSGGFPPVFGWRSRERKNPVSPKPSVKTDGVELTSEGVGSATREPADRTDTAAAAARRSAAAQCCDQRRRAQRPRGERR